MASLSASKDARQEARMNRTTLLKSIAAGAATLAVLSPSVEASVSTVPLTVRIDNVQVGAGPVRIAMFDRRSWLGEALDSAEAPASSLSVHVRLAVPGAGLYGLAVYQDANRDGRLNRNIVGLPTEPVAFSNNAVIRFGPPSFDDAAVPVGVNGGDTIVSLSR
jgi:uncharacterized protein (DUF2141 family)